MLERRWDIWPNTTDLKEEKEWPWCSKSLFERRQDSPHDKKRNRSTTLKGTWRHDDRLVETIKIMWLSLETETLVATTVDGVIANNEMTPSLTTRFCHRRQRRLQWQRQWFFFLRKTLGSRYHIKFSKKYVWN